MVEKDDNETVDILTPEMRDNRTKALAFLFGRLTKLGSDISWCSKRASEILKAAKDQGYSPAVIKLAERLSRMTPEERTAWAAQQSEAGAYFGHSALALDDAGGPKFIPDEQRKEVWGYVEQLSMLGNEKAELGERAKECFSAGKEVGIDPKVLRVVVKLGTMDATDRDDYLGDLNEMVDTLVTCKAMRSTPDV